MAIYRMLEGMAFDEPSVKAMTTAYELVLVDLGLVDRNDPLTELIASKIITSFQMGERDPERLRELTLQDIRE